MENALKQGPVLVPMHPLLLLIYTRLHLFEFEAGEGMKGKLEPVFPFYHKVTDEQTLCCTCQVQDSDYVVHLAGTNWTDGTLRARALVL